MSASLARRYVVPLFEIARDQKELDDVAEDLRSLSEALAGSPELRGFLEAPSIPRSVKQEAVEAIFKKASLLTLAFLRTVIERKRTDVLLLASRIYDGLLNLERGISPGVVESAVELDKGSFKAIEEALAERFGGKVTLEQKVDPSLIGGVRIRVGNKVIDASVKARLEKLKATLTGD